MGGILAFSGESWPSEQAGSLALSQVIKFLLIDTAGRNKLVVVILIIHDFYYTCIIIILVVKFCSRRVVLATSSRVV